MGSGVWKWAADMTAAVQGTARSGLISKMFDQLSCARLPLERQAAIIQLLLM
jgi:hypothetical protein